MTTTEPTPPETPLEAAVRRLFEYLDYVRPDAPRNMTDPYQVSTSGAYSFSDLRLIKAALESSMRDVKRLDWMCQSYADAGVDEDEEENLRYDREYARQRRNGASNLIAVRAAIDAAAMLASGKGEGKT